MFLLNKKNNNFVQQGQLLLAKDIWFGCESCLGRSTLVLHCQNLTTAVCCACTFHLAYESISHILIMFCMEPRYSVSAAACNMSEVSVP